jgi:8-oxo-dGTP pyrophosphatase MutT (NUDIX family)
MNHKNAKNSNPWSVLEADVKFDCQYFSIRQDIVQHAQGAARPYNSVRMKFHGVCVAPIDNEGCLTLVGQYRYVLDRYSWELSGGGSLVGKSHLDTAKAELSEETGMTAEYWLKIVEASVSPGTSDEVTPAYVAWG